MRSREVRNARRFEAWACQAFDVTFVTSPEDAAVLPRAVLVPNGVDLALFRPSPLPDAARLIFTGTLDYPPNVDGVSWFCREVLPRIARECPEVQLDIVGRSPEAEVRRLADGRQVRLHADVPAVLPLLQSARVAVVPLRIGSGTRLKALEAMATCRPVIGTTIGLEGLGVRHGREALVVDDAAAMATAIVGLLHDGAQAQALALSARALVEERFGWDRIGRDFTSALLAAIA